ncbi:FAA-hydrolase domain-containing protein [Mycena chlorophos]|uniref:FAA-hydrolase domain-containing protein n=1 Tax=Mycena chlorophos TaxID=658473 RepID=A0A8H6SDW0_MYCCL|nr:FAA-hydrolase domain-containing protein [Mycena chlorophos]
MITSLPALRLRASLCRRAFSTTPTTFMSASVAAASFVRNGRKIVAIGRNYDLHVKELGNTRPTEPFFFLKPTTSYVLSGGKMEIPHGVLAHHEVELGVVIGKTGRDISQADAAGHIAGYALAVDMTARNVQDHVKKRGLPWSTAKGFDTFTPIGSFIPKDKIADPHKLTLTLKINGAFKQNGSTADMIFQIPRLIEHVSSIMTLEEGDLLLTGTPDGVGPVIAGDKVECALLDTESGAPIEALVFEAVDRQGGYKFAAA